MDLIYIVQAQHTLIVYMLICCTSVKHNLCVITASCPWSPRLTEYKTITTYNLAITDPHAHACQKISSSDQTFCRRQRSVAHFIHHHACFITAFSVTVQRQTVCTVDTKTHGVPHKTGGKSSCLLFQPVPLSIFTAPSMYDSTFSSWNVSLCLVDMGFNRILNDTRHSGSLIKCYRKAILSKVTCLASHQVMVMSILRPKQRQVTLVLLISCVSIIRTTFISAGEKKRERQTKQMNKKKRISSRVSTQKQEIAEK